AVLGGMGKAWPPRGHVPDRDAALLLRLAGAGRQQLAVRGERYRTHTGVTRSFGPNSRRKEDRQDEDAVSEHRMARRRHDGQSFRGEEKSGNAPSIPFRGGYSAGPGPESAPFTGLAAQRYRPVLQDG